MHDKVYFVVVVVGGDVCCKGTCTDTRVPDIFHHHKKKKKKFGIKKTSKRIEVLLVVVGRLLVLPKRWNTLLHDLLYTIHKHER